MSRGLRLAWVAALGLGAALGPGAAPALAFEANGIDLGANEAHVRKVLPSAHCKALEWKSRAADRRCDDARIVFAGIQARITIYLKDDAVQAWDVRFPTNELKRVSEFLRGRWGTPAAEGKELIQRKEQDPREVYNISWTRGKDRAALTAQMEKKRAWVTVSRGDFEEEIYRVR